jgi:glycosidase
MGFYRSVVDLKHANPALWNGSAGGEQVKLDTDGGSRVYAYSRTKGENTVIIAVNFGDMAVRPQYTGLAHSGQFTDWFSKLTVMLGSLGTIEIPAHGYRVLVR